MSLTKEAAKNIIDTIFKKRVTDDANMKTLAHLLELVATDTLSGDKYIRELIQNADDASSTGISFTLVGEYLIFKHNGKHFDANDIEGICDAANPDRLKVEQSEQIGNKGIGFKAVFSLAFEISILSGEASFRFDKYYERWNGHSEHYPWQISPIYTELSHFPEAIQKHYSKDSVNFIFKLQPKLISEIKQHLVKLKTYHFIFLRNVKRCDIYFSEEMMESRHVYLQPPARFVEADGFIIEKLIVDMNQNWWIYRRNCELPENLKQQLAQAENIPKKYKNWKSIPISIAILELNGQLTPLRDIETIFCYLATGLNYNTKFIFNAEFLLDSARMQLRDDSISRAWNGFILQCMLKEHVKFLNALCRKTTFWTDVFEILSFDYNIPNYFLNECTQSFASAIQQYPLVVNLPCTHILTCEQAIVDWFGFIEKFGDDALKQQTAHSKIKNVWRSIQLGSQNFQDSRILEYFTKDWFLKLIRIPEKNKEFIELISWMVTHLKEDDRNKFEKNFKSINLILDYKGELRKLSEVYFPNEKLKYLIGGFDFIKIVHPMISELDQPRRLWLSRMGVQVLTLKQTISLANKAEASLILFLHSLVTRQQNFSSEDWKDLRNLKIITADGKAMTASEIYLPDVFSPEVPLQSFFSNFNPLFLHNYYNYTEGEVSLSKIREFLVKMGVQYTLTEPLLPKIIAAANQYCSAEQLIALTQCLYRYYFHSKIPSDTAISIFKVLKVVCSDNQIRLCSETYLADFYEPNHPLQKIVPNMYFISDKYYMDDIPLKDLVYFFVALGVQQTISIKLYKDPNRGELTKSVVDSHDYFIYLETVYRPLYSYSTSAYMYQHSLTGFYVEISFVRQILQYDLFWEILSSNWDEIRNAMHETKYRTYSDNRIVLSNIHYLVILALQQHYGKEAKPEQFFCQAFSDKLGNFFEGFQIAQITRPLSIEQCAILGFKTKTSAEQTQELLKRISFANEGQRDFNKIVFLYQNLICAIDEEKEPVLQQDCCLLARDNQFKPISELYHITENHLLESKNSKLIKIPQTLSYDAFNKLCNFFQIRCLQFSELEIRLTNQTDSTIASEIFEKLDFCIFAAALADDLSGDSFHKNYVQSRSEMIRQFGTLKFVCAEMIEIHYDDFLNVQQDCWINRESRTVYHLPYEKLDHKNRQILLDFCCEIFELRKHQELFLSIMTSPVEKLKQKYEDEINHCNRHDASPEVAPEIVSIEAVDSKKELKIKAICSGSDDNESYEAVQKDEQPFLRSAENIVQNTNYSPALFGTQKPLSRERHNLDSNVLIINRPISAVAAPVERKVGFFTERFSKEQRKELGRRGEQKVFDFLKQKHIEKYGIDAISEIEDGYIIQEQNGKSRAIHWLNKNGEQYKPYDFEIIVKKPNEQNKLRHLEIKTTTNESDEIEVVYSIGEWEKMLEDNRNEDKSHRLFVVQAKIDADGEVTFSDPIRIDVLNADQVKITEMKKMTIRL